MINPDVFLKKSETLRTSQYIGSFPGYNNNNNNTVVILPDDVSESVVKHAKARLSRYFFDYKAAIRIKEDNGVGWLRHSQITLDERIGMGSFSEIYTIKSIRSADSKRISYDGSDAAAVVVKMVREDMTSKPSSLAKCAANLVKEGIILASLNHKNVIRVQAWTPTGLDGFHIGRADSFFLVLDRLDMTLSKKLVHWETYAKRLKFAFRNRSDKKKEFLNERLEVLVQLADAIKYIHKRHILHRDLKPDNVGFDSVGVLKVYDFDMARKVPKSKNEDKVFAFTRNVGSKRYMSPECARGEKYNLKSDVYSFGLICHEILTLARPFQDISSVQHDEMVYAYMARPELPSSWPKGLCKLLESCWSNDPSQRPTMKYANHKLRQEVPVMLAAKKMKHALVPTRSLSSEKLGEYSASTTTPTISSFGDL